MRSRNGSRSFSLRFFLIIILNSLSLNAGEFLISYRYVVKNAMLYNEVLQISKAMQKCDGKARNSIMLDNGNKSSLKEIISTNNEEFIDYIHELGLQVEHKEKTINAQNLSTTILTLRTTCFKVDFNDNFVIISPLN